MQDRQRRRTTPGVPSSPVILILIPILILPFIPITNPRETDKLQERRKRTRFSGNHDKAADPAPGEECTRPKNR